MWGDCVRTPSSPWSSSVERTTQKNDTLAKYASRRRTQVTATGDLHHTYPAFTLETTHAMKTIGKRIGKTMRTHHIAAMMTLFCVLVSTDGHQMAVGEEAAGDSDAPSFAGVSRLFPLPGTKRMYLHQPSDYKIVEARPDMKLLMKNATGGGYVTGLGFVILNHGQDKRIESLDFAKTHQQFEDNAFPLLKQKVIQAGFVFEQTAFTTTDDADRGLLRVRMRVTPENNESSRALTLAWLAVRQPQDRYYSHGNEDYIVFEPWGPAWQSGLDLRCENGVQHDGEIVFATLHGGDNVSIRPGVHPQLKNFLAVNIDFDRVKEAVVEAAIPYEGLRRPIDPNDRGTDWQAKNAFRRTEAQKLSSLSFDEEYVRQTKRWERHGDRAAAIFVPEAVVNRVYRTLTLNGLQFLGSAPGIAYCKPGQGGFNNFSTVYGWESSQFLTIMDRQGFRDEVRRVLDYFLTTQQGTHGPEGEISTAEGCFRPHIHWMCETGAILRVFAEHALCAGNVDELRRDSPALLKAARWIQNERSRTKKNGADGKKVLHYGLMPRGRATDWPDAGYAFWTDAYTWQGLDRLAAAYEAAKLPDGKWLREEANDYHQCILNAVAAAVKPHPLDPTLQWVPDEVYEDPAKALATTIYAGPQALLGAGVFSPENPLVPVIERSLRKAGCLNDFFAFHMKTMEDADLKQRQERSAGGKVDLYYVTNCERMWHRIWLERGERLKALRFFYMTLAYATSRDVHMVHERFCPQLPWLLPWQPNASGNGRVLEMILNTLAFEKDKSLCLLYGVPDAWFAAGTPLGLRGLHMSFGTFSFQLKPQGQPGSYEFSYECGNEVPKSFLLAIPSGNGKEDRRIVEIASQNQKRATHVIPCNPPSH